MVFKSPADAEDAYYDAIDEGDLEKMMSVWDDSPETACLLPMQPLRQGLQAIRGLWQPMLNREMGVDITVKHLQWIEQGDIAIHLLEEIVTLKKGGDERQPPIYATNIFRKTEKGWVLLLHINSPSPPPPGMQMPI